MTPLKKLADNRVAIIAGAGLLPVYWAREAASRGLEVSVLAVSGWTEEAALRGLSRHYARAGAGRLGEMIDFIKARSISRAVLLGRLGWEEIFKGSGPDQRLKGMLEALQGSRNANSFFNALAREFNAEGIELLEQTLFMENHLAPEGLITPGLEISGSVLRDMDYAYGVAKEISRLGIGQAVVAKHGAVLAVEASEGTDAAIKRSGLLASGGVVAKVRAEKHDVRFDVPSVGLNTIKAMIEAGSAALVLEAGATFIFQRQELAEAALRHNIAIVGKVRANA